MILKSVSCLNEKFIANNSHKNSVFYYVLLGLLHSKFGKMSRKRIGIDVDGVLRDFTLAAIDVYNKEFNENKTIKDMVFYDLKKSFPMLDDADDFFFNKHCKELFYDAPVIDGAKEAFNELASRNDVVILTTQPNSSQKIYTIEWLVKNGFKFNDLCFLHDKNRFGRLDFFIDDNPKKFAGVDAEYGVLIYATYNQFVDLCTLGGCEKIIRCDYLKDFTKIFNV